VFDERQIQDIFDACQTQQEKALIGLVLDTGLRVGEVANLRWNDVHTTHLRVSGKVGERQVPICEESWFLLLGLGDQEHIWIGRFGPLTFDGVQQSYRRIFARAGITGPKSGPHTLRHTFATMYIRHGGKIEALQRILGHQDLKTTMIYVHLAGRDVAEDHALHSPLKVLSAAQDPAPALEVYNHE